MTAWKHAERQLARLIGGQRLPNNGSGQPDVIVSGAVDTWAVEVKHRETLSAWLTDAVDQSDRNAGSDRIPAVVLVHTSQGRKARRLLVVDLARLIEGD